MKNVVKIFGIPMFSLGGVHLISGIAQCTGLSAVCKSLDYMHKTS